MWFAMTNNNGLYSASSCVIVKFLYYLAYLRHYISGYFRVSGTRAVQKNEQKRLIANFI